MNQGFWKNIKKPFFTLAPMADVTDAAFRRVIAKYGKPDVTWTEFVSADGLIKAHDIGKQKLMRDLVFTEAERPIVAQLFGSNPDTMRQAAALVQSLGFDGLDINMGCPVSAIEKQGAGAAMIKKPARAREIIRAAKEGAPNLPVSVKTRIGYNKDEIETWLPELLAEEPALITIHARTRKEMSKVPARWEHVKRAVEIRNQFKKDGKKGGDTLIAGNGDIIDLADARKKIAETGADGAMLGRAIFGNPWLFASSPNLGEVPAGRRGIQEVLPVLLEHTKLFQELLGDIKSFAIMKKHFKSYIAGFDGAHDLRNALMEAKDYAEVGQIIADFLKTA